MSNLDHRKASKTFKVTDANGMPVKNAKLRLLQKSHEFLFGCGGFDFIPLTNAEDEKVKAHFKDLTDISAVLSPKRASPRQRAA